MSGVSSEELLIECVREYPFLYDASDVGYYDNNKKENAWKQISENFNEWTGKYKLNQIKADLYVVHINAFHYTRVEVAKVHFHLEKQNIL